VNLQKYREHRERLKNEEPLFRNLCLKCRQPDFTCYCSVIERLDPKMKFVILIHPIEVRRRIATGRMSHLILEGSHLIKGEDYTHDKELNAILDDPTLYPVILYPGKKAVNLSQTNLSERMKLVPKDKQLALIVIDGTWNTARKMMHVSRNLHALPQVCFSLESESRFRVRKQPAPGCFSTIEAIYHSIELLGATCGFDTSTNEHAKLLKVFDSMVEQQLEFVKLGRGRHAAYRRAQ
jgi:DTW domain-containing protein YfiP